ncbi:MAG: hypothetical protein JW984_15080 [Deltaproteobacteria bacterium]|uniref:Uncharacterized protein n=1 Tax=Candidatus Zymogenus saltonus TaxID=2844893 RepID=A0A9D8PR73_9DELT|nr:hypothetical protein [Candidatus Zymogenus saltonus]
MKKKVEVKKSGKDLKGWIWHVKMIEPQNGGPVQFVATYFIRGKSYSYTDHCPAKAMRAVEDYLDKNGV